MLDTSVEIINTNGKEKYILKYNNESFLYIDGGLDLKDENQISIIMPYIKTDAELKNKFFNISFTERLNQIQIKNYSVFQQFGGSWIHLVPKEDIGIFKQIIISREIESIKDDKIKQIKEILDFIEGNNPEIEREILKDMNEEQKKLLTEIKGTFYNFFNSYFIFTNSTKPHIKKQFIEKVRNIIQNQKSKEEYQKTGFDNSYKFTTFSEEYWRFFKEERNFKSKLIQKYHPYFPNFVKIPIK